MNKYEINALIEYIKAEIDAKVAEHHSTPTHAQDCQETANDLENVLHNILRR